MNALRSYSLVYKIYKNIFIKQAGNNAMHLSHVSKSYDINRIGHCHKIQFKFLAIVLQDIENFMDCIAIDKIM